MPDSIAQEHPESRLRRWWRGFHAAVEGMEISGHEHLADRIDALEARLRRLEAGSASAADDSGPLHPQHGAHHHG
jgi:hypothetical protein